MDVMVRVDLSGRVGRKHLKEMRSAALRLTNDRRSVHVHKDRGKLQAMLAEFTIKKRRQMDVVDRIIDAFALFMPDYDYSTIWFPKPNPKKKTRAQPCHGK